MQMIQSITLLEEKLLQDAEARRKYQQGGKRTPTLSIDSEDMEDDSDDERETEEEERDEIARLYARIIESSINNAAFKKYLEKSGKTIQQMQEHFKQKRVEVIVKKDPVSQGIYV